jgi:methionine synthase II (cobalamin-independent)
VAGGMQYLSREVAFGKLVAMVEGTRRVRALL